jgi:predicted methyltransferase
MIAAIPDTLRRLASTLAIAGLGLLGNASALAGDIYDSAVAHTGRSEEDRKRDSLDKPAEILRLSGIKPGMHVADFMAGDGYYSELLSYVAGPKGHVLLLNNPSFDRWSNNAWQQRVAGNRLPNVEHETVDLNKLPLEPASLDAILMIKVYHDLYWVDTDNTANWPKVDTSAVLDKLVAALKPHGVLVVVDHSAQPGTGATAAGSLHRIDETYARHDFESRGLKLVTRSDILRRSDDPRTQVSYKEPILGKTDRFVLVFRKQGK